LNVLELLILSSKSPNTLHISLFSV
jgi:hypothetical protein